LGKTQREAKSGLDAIVAQLPNVRNFDRVKLLEHYTTNEPNSGPPTCYYAMADIITGSSASDQITKETVDAYIQDLQKLGWTLDKYPIGSTRTLSRNPSERIEIDTYHPADLRYNSLINEIDSNQWQDWKETFQNLIIVEPHYTLPPYKGC
jgi:hypothetical protein